MKQLTKSDFQTTIAKGKTVVDYWAPWCGPCKMFAPVFEATAKEYAGITFAKLNTDEEPEIAGQSGIRGIPTLIFYKDGKEVGRVSGMMPKPQFEQLLKQMFP